MLDRVLEPELMLEPEHVAAYAAADFAVPHNAAAAGFVAAFAPDRDVALEILDLGCGPCDVTLRLAELLPNARFWAVDGSAPMLDAAAAAIAAAGCGDRFRLRQVRFGDGSLDGFGAEIVMSTSVLHHLADPQVLWRQIRTAGRPGAGVYVVDLRRPDSTAAAAALVDTYAADEPAVLREDFFNSLLAAFTPDEVAAQLDAAGVAAQVTPVGDRHLRVVGRVPSAGG